MGLPLIIMILELRKGIREQIFPYALFFSCSRRAAFASKILTTNAFDFSYFSIPFYF